jgi:hypothetical protein
MDNPAHCPACGAVLSEGSPCPRCAITLPRPRPAPATQIVAGEPSPSPPPLVPEAPLSRAWLTAQSALTVLHIGLVIEFLGKLAIGVALAIPLLEFASKPAAAPQPSIPAAVLVLAALGALAVPAGWVVVLVGEQIAGGTPSEAGARGRARGAWRFGVIGKGLTLLGVLLLVHAWVLPGPRADDGAGTVPSGVSGPLIWVLVLGGALASVAEVVCAALYLRAVARYFGANLLARRAGEYARFFPTFTAVLFAANYFSGYLVRVLPGDLETKARMVPILLVVEMGCFLILAAQLLGLVKETRNTVARALGKPTDPPAAV